MDWGPFVQTLVFTGIVCVAFKCSLNYLDGHGLTLRTYCSKCGKHCLVEVVKWNQ